ncbi:MAG: hypothetical protein FJZ80_08035 [Bacteroidetes bacterium]|nr:hypothetical protein [Bacteroidota bacterium]MBM3424619.1 hypothetical protein [Bacteroidota bacterium]
MRIGAISQIQLHDSPIYSLATRGDFLYTGSADKTVKKLSASSLVLQNFTVRTSHACISLFATSSGWLCLGLLNGDFHVLDANSNQELFSHSFGEGGIFAISAPPDANRLYLGFSSGRIAVIDASTFEILTFEAIAKDKIRKLYFSDNGTNLYVASKDGSVSVMEASGFTLEFSWYPHQSGTNALVLTKDGRCITSGKDGFIRIWQVNSFHLMHEFPAHRGVIYDLAVVDNYLLSASRDKSIKAWDLATFRPVQKLSQHRQSVNVIVQQNQNSFVSASDDGTLIFWKLD